MSAGKSIERLLRARDGHAALEAVRGGARVGPGELLRLLKARTCASIQAAEPPARSASRTIARTEADLNDEALAEAYARTCAGAPEILAGSPRLLGIVRKEGYCADGFAVACSDPARPPFGRMAHEQRLALARALVRTDPAVPLRRPSDRILFRRGRSEPGPDDPPCWVLSACIDGAGDEFLPGDGTGLPPKLLFEFLSEACRPDLPANHPAAARVAGTLAGSDAFGALCRGERTADPFSPVRELMGRAFRVGSAEAGSASQIRRSAEGFASAIALPCAAFAAEHPCAYSDAFASLAAILADAGRKQAERLARAGRISEAADAFLAPAAALARLPAPEEPVEPERMKLGWIDTQRLSALAGGPDPFFGSRREIGAAFLAESERLRLSNACAPARADRTAELP